MSMTNARLAIPLSLLGCLVAQPATADPFSFSTGSPDGKMATASRPSSAGKFEIESADDFVLTTTTDITSATFTGLLTGGASVSDIGEVRVEIYRVFPALSDVGRTSGPPTFSTSQVPTRVNSPSDVELADRDTSPAPGNLTFTTTVLRTTFTAANSVQPGGIHPKPGQTTGGDLGVTGEEVMFSVDFMTPFDLPADHYFFVPQVEVTTANGEVLWLSAPKPIVPNPFPPGTTDLQSWTRDQFLDPDWLRVGTDIVGAVGGPPPVITQFNAAFSLTGNTDIVPGPIVGAGLPGLIAGCCFLIALARHRRSKAA